MRNYFLVCFTLLIGFGFSIACGALLPTPKVTLADSLKPSPIINLAAGAVEIKGTAAVSNLALVRVRVTTAFGNAFTLPIKVANQRFACRFPQDFPGATALAPMLLYVDATVAEDFGGAALLTNQAEAMLIVTGNGAARWPDLPVAFMDDLLDAAGNKDGAAAQWPQQRALVNLFMRSRAARLARVGRDGFDLARPADFAWFNNNLALYDFDHRDRDWSQPLGHRVARGYWQAVWNTWFNASNNHPWDDNPANRAPSNYRPYVFANDFADLLVLHQMRRGLTPAYADNRQQLGQEALANLLAMQHRAPTNFALPEAGRKQEHYTAGAFRYGLFETGEWLTEGKGWFVNPRHGDHRQGGVFNGRAVWALGESLKADPKGPLAAQTRAAITLALRFCLRDGLTRGYARELRPGQVFWRDAGEHGYLLLGMLAACEVAPDLPVTLADGQPPCPLRQLCADTLDALVSAAKPAGNWTPYPDQDGMAIAALATGARVLARHPQRDQWLKAAVTAADDWLDAPVDPAERRSPAPHFGYRQGRGMTYHFGDDRRVRFTFYQTGHWLHALAKLHALTGTERYARRCHAMLAYLCGDNPFHARLFNEVGAVHNYVLDANGDGLEDTLHYDLYPESTAFVQIGLLHFLPP